jgi:hypothetical protein
MAKMGRPVKQIDADAFEKLCAIWCTITDIAGFFDCSVDTIERFCQAQYKATFAAVYKAKSSIGRVSLRRKQYEVAMAGSVPLLIWLGKQHLDQRERREEWTDDRTDDLAEIPTAKLLELVKAKA